MNDALSKTSLHSALTHLRASDPVMARVIGQVGPCALRANPNRFQMLAKSIISQQISTAAARSIRAKLDRLLQPRKLSPESLQDFTPEQLRTAGLSAQKIAYLRDLSQKVTAGHVRLRGIARKSDEEVIDELVQVKGIGVWTAQMFLIFSLGRLDVFPHGDLGVRSALRNLYGLKELPDKETSIGIAAPWRPYATVASWYCWRSLELRA